jgi:hypothetical protein
MISPLPKELKIIIIDYLDDFGEKYNEVVHSIRSNFHGDIPFTVSENFFPAHSRSDILLVSLSIDHNTVSLERFRKMFLLAWEWFFTDSLYYEDILYEIN